MTKRAVLTGGGTAGHLYPALALAEQVQDRGWGVRYPGTPKGVEARLVPEAGIPFQPFNASGFNRSRPWTLVSGVARIASSQRKAKKWLQEVKPDAVIGFGGYVSIPVVRAAESLGIPVIIHEQNSVMGLANANASKHASTVCLTYQVTAKDVPESVPVRVIGNPVRRQVMEADRESARRELGIPEDAVMLLAFGGSLGATHINKAVASMKDDLLARPQAFVMRVAGKRDFQMMQEELALTEDEASRYQLIDYQDRMPLALAAADLIVSRAGATSLAEISARKIPAVLVPFPYATADHQTTNAREWVESGAALMFADSEVEGDQFKQAVLNLMDDSNARASMVAASGPSSSVHAACALADAVEEVASGSAC